MDSGKGGMTVILSAAHAHWRIVYIQVMMFNIIGVIGSSRGDHKVKAGNSRTKVT
jgi:hypothetical protein